MPPKGLTDVSDNDSVKAVPTVKEGEAGTDIAVEKRDGDENLSEEEIAKRDAEPPFGTLDMALGRDRGAQVNGQHPVTTLAQLRNWCIDRGVGVKQEWTDKVKKLEIDAAEALKKEGDKLRESHNKEK